MGVILDRIGMEIEGLYGTRDEIHHYLAVMMGDDISLLSEIHRDASVETPMRTFGGIGLINPPNSILHQTRNTVYGYEIVSRPLDVKEIEKFVSKVLIGLQRFGENFSPRTSIHIHIGFPESLSFLKRGLILGLKMDPLLYRLAGLGKPYRGSINSSIYAKPLVSPPYIQGENSGSWYQLKPSLGLTATSILDFWKGYAINYEPGNNYERFTPARYFAWNLYSVLIRGTLEFRYFNLCLNPEWVLTIVHLCQALVEMAVTEIIPEFPSLDIYKKYSNSVYEEFIDQLLYTIKNSDTMLYKEIIYRKNTLMRILNATPEPIFEKKEIMSHVNRPTSDRFLLSCGLSATKHRVERSGFVDIHTPEVSDTSEMLV
jgi:hypothetical protein